jgi:hypothetical protein
LSSSRVNLPPIFTKSRLPSICEGIKRVTRQVTCEETAFY